jgi:hypothetical protein
VPTNRTFVGLVMTAGGNTMSGLGKAIVVGVAVLGFVSLPPASGGDKNADKVRGRIQEYERARRLLVVHPKSKVSQAREAVREAGFKVVEHERNLDALRSRWDGNDRKKLEQMLEKLAASPAVRLIEPDPR